MRIMSLINSDDALDGDEATSNADGEDADLSVVLDRLTGQPLPNDILIHAVRCYIHTEFK